MKKYDKDLLVVTVDYLNAHHVLLTLKDPDGKALPEMKPGQFVQIYVENSPSTFLRRPISINYVCREREEMALLIQEKGEGTRHLMNLNPGDLVRVMLPLGNGFTMPAEGEKLLLVGGGVGVAPLLYFGMELKKQGIEPTFLLGARTADALLELDKFEALGRVFVTTEDGSAGEKGFVTGHSVFDKEHFDRMSVCGPLPMMKAVARLAREKDIDCEVSLENMMACGLGACLCCVENTVKGNVCVCKEGPVFNIKDLLWQI